MEAFIHGYVELFRNGITVVSMVFRNDPNKDFYSWEMPDSLSGMP